MKDNVNTLRRSPGFGWSARGDGELIGLQCRRGLLLLGSMLGAIALAACGGDRDFTAREDLAAPPVEAVQTRAGALPLVERLSGTVRAENQVVLYPEVTERIAAVHVQSGDTVAQGQPLVTLRDDQYREQVRQAEAGHRINEARLRQAKARLAELAAQASRTRALGEQDLVTELEVETASAQMESASADVALAEAQLEQSAATLAEQRDLLAKTVIRAPIAGVVGQRNAEVGMQATASTPLFTIGNFDRVKIRVHVTDVMLRHLAPGQPVEIFPTGGDAGEAPLRAELTRISPFLSEVSRSTEAEIETTNPGHRLRPGMFVPVNIHYGQSRHATLIPSSALFTDPNTGREGVFVVEASRLLAPEAAALETDAATSPTGSDAPAPTGGASRLTEPLPVSFRPVTVVARGEMEIATDAIAAGDWVVTLGQDLLAAGREQARVRAVTWEHVLTLQGLKREDLLEHVLRSTSSGGGGAPTSAK